MRFGLASGLAGVLFVTGSWLRERRMNTEGTVSIAMISGLVSERDGGLPGALTPAWSPGAMDGRSSNEARAVRIGARLADIEIVAHQRFAHGVRAYYGRDSTALAIVAGSSERAAAIIADLIRELDRIPGGDVTVQWYQEVERLARLRDYFHLRAVEARATLPRVRPRFVATGFWLEYARVAARRGDTAFFRQPESQVVTAEARRLPGLSSQARAALGDVQLLVASESPVDMVVLERALTSALVALAR